MQSNSQVHAEHEYLSYPVSCPVSWRLQVLVERRRSQSPIRLRSLEQKHTAGPASPAIRQSDRRAGGKGAHGDAPLLGTKGKRYR